MAELYLNQSRPVFGANGGIEAGAKAYFYLTGTTTKTPIYSDAALTTELTNPVVANAAGVFPSIYLDTDNVTYRVYLTDANDVLLSNVDPYYPGDLNEAVQASVTAAANSASAAVQAAADAAAIAAFRVGVARSTKAALDALAGPFSEGDSGAVYSDATAANNGVYSYTGGSWAKLSDLPEVSAAASAERAEAAEGDVIAAKDAALVEIGAEVDKAEAWATGTEPGGAGTKSAREWSIEASGFAPLADGDTSSAAFFDRDSAGGFVSGIRSDGLTLKNADPTRPVYYTDTINGQRQVFVRTRSGVRQLTAQGENFGVEVLNAGRIAFVSTRRGSPEIYEMNAAGGGQKPFDGDGDATLDLIIVEGQSLAVSNTAGQVTSPVNTDARLRQLALSGGNNGPRTMIDSSRAESVVSDPIEPNEIVGAATLTDVTSPNPSQAHYGQTICTGMGQQLLQGVSDPDLQIGFSVIGLGARTIDELDGGNDNWQNLHRVEAAWRIHSTRHVAPRAIVLIHDHAHIASGFTREQQRDALLQYVEDRQMHMIAETAGEAAVPILVTQSGNATYSVTTNEQCRNVWLGTLDAVAMHPALHLIGQMAFLETHDGTHLTAGSADWLGEYAGKVLRHVESGNWKHTGFDHSRAHDLNGTSLFVPCQSQSGALRELFDPIVARPNHGFNFEDGGGGSVTLTGAPTIDNEAGGLIFTLSGTPSGGTLYSGSSATTATQIGQDPSRADSAGVNIADTENLVGARTGKAMPNIFIADAWENI